MLKIIQQYRLLPTPHRPFIEKLSYSSDVTLSEKEKFALIVEVVKKEFCA